jgi:hypothetical protein
VPSEQSVTHNWIRPINSNQLACELHFLTSSEATLPSFSNYLWQLAKHVTLNSSKQHTCNEFLMSCSSTTPESPWIKIYKFSYIFASLLQLLVMVQCISW